jgi:hypothetical protein
MLSNLKLVDETIRGEYGDLFPLENELIVGVKIPFCWFFSTNCLSSSIKDTQR